MSMNIEKTTLAAVAVIIESNEKEIDRTEALRDFMINLKKGDNDQFKSLQFFIDHQMIVNESHSKYFYYPSLGVLGFIWKIILFYPLFFGLYLIITPSVSVSMPWIANYPVHPPLLGLMFISLFGCIESLIRMRARIELNKLRGVKMVMKSVELGTDPVDIVRMKDALIDTEKRWFKRF